MDGHLDGVLVIGGHLVALEEVSDVLPIGHDQTFESELIPKDVREDVTVRVDGDAIGLAAVDHDGGGAGFDGCSERREEDFPQLALGDPGRRAVLAGQRAAVAHVVLEAGGNGGGAFLVSLDHGHAHVGHQARRFAKGLPESGPTGVAGDVQNRGEVPGNAGSQDLLGCVLGELPDERRVPGGGQSELLRAQYATGGVCGTMNGINAIQDGDAGRLLCCFVLDAADELVPFLRGVGMSNTVQNAAHAEIDEDVV